MILDKMLKFRGLITLKEKNNANEIYYLESIVDLVKKYREDIENDSLKLLDKIFNDYFK